MHICSQEIYKIVHSIESVEHLLADLENYAREYTTKNTTELGSRECMWLLSAITKIAEVNNERMEEETKWMTGHIMEKNQQSPDDKDYFRLASALSSNGILFRELTYWGVKDKTKANLMARIYEYGSIAKENIIEILRSKEIDQYQYYSIYLLWSACLESGTSLEDEEIEKMFSTALEILQKEIVYYECNTGKYNYINAAISVAILCKYCDLDHNKDKELIHAMIRKILEYTYGSNRNIISHKERLVQRVNKVGWLSSFPGEELYIMREVSTDDYPADMGYIDNYINLLKGRCVEIEHNRAMYYEGSASGYSVSPYFTFYAITTLSVQRGLLKKLLKRKVAERLAQYEQVALTSPIKLGLSLDDENILETYEETYSYLKKVFNSGRAGENARKYNTILLFGPPGTGKTTLVKALTGYLINQKKEGKFRNDVEWGVMIINPLIILNEDTYSGILDNVKGLFSILRNLDNCVILIDEAEELFRSREEGGLRFGRMFTAAMLPILSTLAETNSIYIFATNYINKMDPAAIRKGRFAIRKGLGWANKVSIRKYVANNYSAMEHDLQNAIADSMHEMPIKEVLDYGKVVRDVKTKKELEREIGKWKNYLSEEVINLHKENCTKFDDSTK